MIQEIKDIMTDTIVKIAKLEEKYTKNSHYCRNEKEYNYLLTAIADCDNALSVLLSVKGIDTTSIKANFDERKNGFLAQSVDAIFSGRTANCLISADIKEIADLNELQPKDFLKIRNAGKASQQEIIKLCRHNGYEWNSKGLTKIEQ